ncbi:hypothetical protein JCM18237_11900 [Halorubrum luteum]
MDDLEVVIVNERRLEKLLRVGIVTHANPDGSTAGGYSDDCKETDHDREETGVHHTNRLRRLE